MNSTPMTAEVGTSREVLRAIMKRKDILSIPILDDGKVVDLVTINGIDNKLQSSFKLSSFIFAIHVPGYFCYFTIEQSKPVLL